MKKNSPFFNKKSRLIKAPELDDISPAKLAPFSKSAIRRKLPELLTVQNDFFPCFDWVFPPPLLSKSTPPDHADELFIEPSIIPGGYSIYLHSPFCKSLCSFCYYAIIPGHGIDIAEKYVEHLIKEMTLYSNTLRGQTCESIYFGGGTPSFLSDELLTRIFSSLHHNFSIDPLAEITIESAPGTLPKEKCELLKSLGVNRLSYGIQTLDEKLLANMNRDYTVSQAVEELSHAIDIIGNVNVDTMYGFDGEEDDTLINTLKRFHEIGVPSFSVYALDKQRSEGKVQLEPPRDDHYEHKIVKFAQAEDYLKGLGYKPVLQNIFIDPERASYRHQLRRWDNLPLVAMGINSQGYAPRKAYQNTASLKSYYQMINEGKLPLATMDELDPELELCRELTSKLRFTYISLSEFKYKYGISIDVVFAHLINSLSELGYIECRDDILRMTEKAAYYNNIIPMLFAPDKFKEKLMGLPEEYLETFPVPFIMTQLGSAQSASFDFIGSQHIANAERRVNWSRRLKHKEDKFENRRSGSGRRTTDGLWKWSATNDLSDAAQ